MTQAPASSRDGAGRGDTLVAAAEASSRVGPAGEESAGDGSAGRGALDRPACESGPVSRDAFAGLAPVARGGKEEGA